ncbi:uncharacterized protein LOC129216038 [Uloborus diversus]|uniref:uncharacterized protein LOC129216038 n=1 Tax=Uloborus diversus TaxID=327109 RepID=UPI002408FFD8|nr:uncharacterized protein LOC129216038 [Uloborus diversus]
MTTDSEVSLMYSSQVRSPETPSKSLMGDCSVTFSPPSIIKEAMLDAHLPSDLNNAFIVPAPSNKRKRRRKDDHTPRKFDFNMAFCKWGQVTFGRTSDQLELTERARSWVTSLRPRCLNL